MNVAMKFLTGLVLCTAVTGGVLASEVVGTAPFAGSNYGQQSDANSAPYSQAFVAPAGSIVESIRWWGFHGAGSMGSDFDSFVIFLDGVMQTGTLTATNLSPFYTEYMLDIPDAALTSSSLSIVNYSFDVEWYWQSAPAVGNVGAPDASAVAFSLIGHFGEMTVPEPTSQSLLILALLVLLINRSAIAWKWSRRA